MEPLDSLTRAGLSSISSFLIIQQVRMLEAVADVMSIKLMNDNLDGKAHSFMKLLDAEVDRLRHALEDPEYRQFLQQCKRNNADPQAVFIERARKLTMGSPSGSFFELIRDVRNGLNIGLREAKQFVDDHAVNRYKDSC